MDIPSMQSASGQLAPGLGSPAPQAGPQSGKGAAGQLPAALQPPATTAGSQATSTGATGSAGAPAAASTVSAQQQQALQHALAKLNKQLEQRSAGVTLSAGLDTSGQHPGQVLVELADKQTKQTFYKYYLPPQNVIQAAEQSGSGSAAGVLLSTKA